MKYLVLLLVSFSLSAQEDDFGADDVKDVTITKSKDSKKGFWKNFLRKSFSGSIGYAGIFGTEDTNRSYSHARLRFNYSPFSTTKIVAEGLFEHTEIQFPLVAKESARRRRYGDEHLLKYSKSNFRPEEFYISQEVFDMLTVSYGVQKVVWGQFEPYSPTNLVFPFNLSTTDVEFNKIKGTLPQEVAVVNFYPTSKVSLSLYAFPKLTYDKILQKRLDDPGQQLDGSATRVVLPSGSDEMQTGARLMFYPSWGTFGFSYHDGYKTDDVGEFSRFRGFSGLGDALTTSHLGFYKREMYGFEVAVPMGRFTYKLEMSSSKSRDVLETPYFASSPEVMDYANAILSENNGNLTIPVDSDIVAAGITGDLKRWYLNLVLFYLGDRYDDKTQRLLDLQEKAYPEDSDGFDGPIFPGLVVSRYLKDDKSSEIGLAAGIIGNGHGGALFYKRTTDSFVYGAALQSIEYFSDDSFTEGNADDEYEKKSLSNTGLLLSATYKF